MKYLRRFNTFINESSRLLQLGLIGLNDEQKEFLDKYINGSWEFDSETGLVNIDGDLLCNSEDLTDFKGIRFGRVNGDFYCYNNRLTSLEGAPQLVSGSFDCSINELTSLEGAPQQVGGKFDCSRNQLTSLEGAPQQVGGIFRCSFNRLTSLEGAPQRVGGGFRCGFNPDLQGLAGLPTLHNVYVPQHLEERLELMRAEARKLKSNKLESEE